MVHFPVFEVELNQDPRSFQGQPSNWGCLLSGFPSVKAAAQGGWTLDAHH